MEIYKQQSEIVRRHLLAI